MRLPTNEYIEFMELYPRLLFYVGHRKGMLNKKMVYDEFIEIDMQLRLNIRDELFKHPKWIDEYIRLHKDELTEDNIETLQGFHHFMAGEFILFKHLKDYSILINEDVAYGVIGLGDSLYDFFGDDIPLYIKVVLLPYKGKIIIDGLVQSYPVRFGRHYKASFNNTYKAAKAKYGIVTTLPFDKKPAYKKLPIAEQVKYFLKNADHRERFAEDLEELIETQSKAVPVYHQEMGKIHARTFKKQLKAMDLSKAYYAVLEGNIICSDLQKEDLDVTLRKLVPPDKWDWIYIFRV